MISGVWLLAHVYIHGVGVYLYSVELTPFEGLLFKGKF